MAAAQATPHPPGPTARIASPGAGSRGCVAPAGGWDGNPGAATVVPIINAPRNMLTRRKLPQCVACFGDASDLADEVRRWSGASPPSPAHLR